MKDEAFEQLGKIKELEKGKVNLYRELNISMLIADKFPGIFDAGSVQTSYVKIRSKDNVTLLQATEITDGDGKKYTVDIELGLKLGLLQANQLGWEEVPIAPHRKEEIKEEKNPLGGL